MSDFSFPTQGELKEVEQELLPRLMQDRKIFTFFPMENVESHLLMWEQEDNYVGLQQLRGLGGKPGAVQRVGGKRYTAEPGYYGEFIPIDETELTLRRRYGTFGQKIALNDLVRKAQDQLLQRRLDRIEQIGWTLLTTGTFSVSGATGIVHTDTYSVQNYTAGVPWGTSATATPLANLRAMQLLHRGKSVSFSRDSTLLINQVTCNKLLSNTNNNDLAGRRVTGLLSPLNLEEVNKILAGENLPQIEVFDEGYLNDAGTFVPWIADDKGVLIGKRAGGARIAEYRMTFNLNNPGGASGAYTKVLDFSEKEVPARLEVHDGHNGGPVMYFPSAVVRGNF